MRNHRCAAVAVFVRVLLTFEVARAGVTGNISGVVRDRSGAVLAGASVVATNTLTGVNSAVATDAKGLQLVLKTLL